MDSKYDVVVIGGGTAGVIAAIQAGRAGAKTLLIEKNGIPGGTIVVGGIPDPASFHAYDTQLIAGIGWELCCKARQEDGESIPNPKNMTGQSSGRLHFHLNPAVYAAICDEELLDSGVDILFHAMPAVLNYTDNCWVLDICTKTGLKQIKSSEIIDCTGDANVVELAGLSITRNEDQQPGTLVVYVNGYDEKDLDYPSIQTAFEKEVAAGRMKITDPGWGKGDFRFFLRNNGGNRIHIPHLDARDSEGRSMAEIEGRQAMMRILRFCHQQPGLENMKISYCAPECGIRETAIIKGKKFITIADYESGKLWDDAVCYSFYPVDIHRKDWIDFRVIPAGIYPTIPLGAMLPEGSRHIITAGRCVAGDQVANSAYRVEASCMAMGQAAGAAAALAAKMNLDFEELPMEKLYELLRQHDAIIPGDL